MANVGPAYHVVDKGDAKESHQRITSPPGKLAEPKPIFSITVELFREWTEPAVYHILSNKIALSIRPKPAFNLVLSAHLIVGFDFRLLQ